MFKVPVQLLIMQQCFYALLTCLSTVQSDEWYGFTAPAFVSQPGTILWLEKEEKREALKSNIKIHNMGCGMQGYKQCLFSNLYKSVYAKWLQFFLLYRHISQNDLPVPKAL